VADRAATAGGSSRTVSEVARAIDQASLYLPQCGTELVDLQA